MVEYVNVMLPYTIGDEVESATALSDVLSWTCAGDELASVELVEEAALAKRGNAVFVVSWS